MSENIIQDELNVKRNRLSKVFHYLYDFNQIRNPSKKLINEQPWFLWLKDLPHHPSIQGVAYGYNDATEEEHGSADGNITEACQEDFILKAKRPDLTDCPFPPKELKDWILPGWERPEGDVEHLKSLDRTDEEGNLYAERFEDDQTRVELYEKWIKDRTAWQESERTARRAMEIFEKLYGVYMQLQREGEKFELVLGDGLLGWRRSEGVVFHPILLQRLQIKLNPDIPEISIHETDHPVEFYTALFSSMQDVKGRIFGELRDELRKNNYYPLGGEEINSFLRKILLSLSSQGKLVEEIDLRTIGDDPVISREAVLFLRTRTLGYEKAIESIISDMDRRQDFSYSLLNIVSIHREDQLCDFKEKAGVFRTANEDEEVLFSKPANDEQLQIARRLLRHNSVLVQGPPGTGKSHTIANLIGHLLSQGKDILVTSYSTKALRVLREQIVEDIRPLCVSVLDRDEESKRQLENSILTIIRKMEEDHNKLESEAGLLENRRSELLREIDKTRIKIREALQGEYTSISIGGEQIQPSEAAKKVHKGAGIDDWIPGKVAKGEPLPLSEVELGQLYQSNITIT